MKLISELLSSSVAETLARVLLHSLWQSGAVLLLLVLCLRFIPTHRSTLRYGLSCAGMLLIVTLSVATLILNTGAETPAATNANVSLYHLASIQHSAQPLHWTEKLNHFIADHAAVISATWLAGTFLFLLRLTGGWWYIRRITNQATVLTNDLSARLDTLARRLNIKRAVTLAESTIVHAPVVIGYVKPMLLLPVGLASGLSTAQLEAIFIHELMHIKRHDYLINIIQSVLESAFFFNPFVWMISSIIRREREHCCDDAVEACGGNTRAYVYALAQLEEARHTRSPFVLSVSGSKHELLIRIKRLMEKSIRHYSIREKLAPAMVLIAGLMCASWLSISSSHRSTYFSLNGDKQLAADTSRKKKDKEKADLKDEKTATYSRKKIITIGPDGKPHEEITEEFTGDEELKDMLSDFSFDMPHFNFNMDSVMPPVPALSMIPPIDPFFQHTFPLDSLPEPVRPFSNNEEWEQFTKEFQQKFSEHFQNFYAENHTAIEQMMKEFENKFQHQFNEEWRNNIEANARKHEEYLKRHQEHLRRSEDRIKKHEAHRKKLEEKMKQWEKDNAPKMEAFEKKMKEWEKKHAPEMEALEKKMKAVEEKMKGFETELRNLLMKDGYLQPKDTIHNMQWREEGTIEINGRKIKKADEPKYNALHRKYFGDKAGNFTFTE